MLRYFNRKIRGNRKGFSLIELIVVVGILGILAAVAIPRVTTSLTTARENTDSANLRTLNNAVELYNAEQEGYPAQPANATAFETTMAAYLPDGVPDTQVTTNHFFYYNDAPAAKVMYAADAAACATATADDTDASTDWIRID